MPHSFFKLLRLAPGEGRKILWLSLNLALGCVLLMLLRTLTTALFLASYEASLLPWLFAAQALFFTLLSLIQSLLVGRVSRASQVLGLEWLFLTALLLGRLALEFQAIWVVFALYVVLQSLGELLLIEAAILQNASFNAREARRLQPLVNAGGTLGAVLGGLLGAWLPGSLGTENSLMIGAAFLGLMIMVTSRVMKTYVKPLDAQRPSSGGTPALMTGLLAPFQNRLMGLFLLLLFCSFLASTLVDFQMKTLLKASFDKEEMATFLGIFYASLNALTFVLQLLANSHFLQLFGLIGGLVLPPLILLLGSSLFLALPLLWVATGTRFGEYLASYSLFKDASNLLYMPFSPADQGRLNLLGRGVLRPLGVLSASFFLILVGTSFTLWQISLVALGFSALAALAALGMRTPYVAELRRALSDRRIRLKPHESLGNWGGRELRRQIETRLGCGEAASLHFALELIREQGIKINPRALTPLLAHPSAEVRKDVLATLDVLRPAEVLEELRQHLHLTQAPEEIAALLRLLRLLGDKTLRQMAGPWLTHPHWQVQGQALAALGSGGEPGQLQGILDALQSPDSVPAAAAALAVAELDLQEAAPSIKEMLSQSDPLRQVAAMRAALALRRLELAPALIELLTQPALSHEITLGLARLGKPLVPDLVKVWRQHETGLLHKGISEVLGRIPSRTSALALLELLTQSQGPKRDWLLAALNRQRHWRESSREEKAQVRRVLTQELELAKAEQGLLSQIVTAKPSFFPIPGRRALLEDEIQKRLHLRRQRLFQLLGLLGRTRDMERVWHNYNSGDQRLRAGSLELLDNILERALAVPVLSLLEGVEAVPPRTGVDEASIGAALTPLDDWLGLCTAFATGLPLSAQGESSMNPALMTQVERVFFLKSVPIFTDLSGEALQPLAEVFQEQMIPAGGLVFAQGEASDRFYLVVAGRVSVRRGLRELAVLGQGAAFGEMALLDNEVRSASLVALEDTELLSLDRDSFHEVLEEYPEVARAIMRALSRRLRDSLGDEM